MQSSGHSISWETGDVPRSSLFDDTFYTRRNGQAETAYVFVDGNGLPGRWADAGRFTIGELGFGTGLGFLETWRRWIEARSPSQCLVFTSFEAYPIRADDMARALEPWETLTPLSGTLVSRWRARSTLAMPWQMDEQTQLHVMPGEAEASVANWPGLADAWYLDGFSPDKNPAMWSAALMQQVFDHTAAGGSFATYTAATRVRRHLQDAGFAVNKRKGFAGKREMMFGQRTAGPVGTRYAIAVRDA